MKLYHKAASRLKKVHKKIKKSAQFLMRVESDKLLQRIGIERWGVGVNGVTEYCTNVAGQVPVFSS